MLVSSAETGTMNTGFKHSTGFNLHLPTEAGNAVVSTLSTVAVSELLYTTVH